MLRIELIANDARDMTIRAAGRLAGPWVQELAQSLGAHAGDVTLVIDLRDVSFADTDGVALLRSLQAETRISLRCSPFLAAQLA
jgi:anti-anti-sigma regulatory factor